jgi:ketosteroid isomerase-like protein
MTQEESNIRLVRDYYAAVQHGAADDALSRFYAAAVVQEEFPNRFLPSGATRDLQALKEAAARGRGVMAAQEFELLNIVAAGNQVAVEARWAGTLAKAIGPICGRHRHAGTVWPVLRDSRRPDRQAAQLRLLRSMVGGEES